VVLCLSMLMIPITASGAGVSLASISHDLHAGANATSWVVNGFLLTFASFMGLTGSLADLIGRRKVFAWGLVVFAAGLLISGLAPSIVVLITARCVTGAAATAVTTSGSALLAVAYEGPARARALSFFGTTSLSQRKVGWGPEAVSVETFQEVSVRR